MSDLMEGGGKRLVVLAITEYGEDPATGKKRTKWTRIGRAFSNRDGSTTLLLDAFPIGSAKLQIREEDRERDRAFADRGGAGANGSARNDFETLEVRP
jgi:hypothetical protein